MPKIVVIDRLGELKTVNAKDITSDNLYKKAGIKSGEGFVLQHTWGQENGIDQSIELYAKTKGKAGQENKYDFPPPVDNTLFFGPCVLLGKDSNTGRIVDLDEDEWEEIYEFMFGGFEDLDSEDSDDVDTDDEVEELEKTTGTTVAQTKNGYVKDGFVVSDDEDDEDYEESESEEDIPKKKSKSNKRKLLAKSIASAIAKSNTKDKESEAAQEAATDLVELEDCESELSEESYAT